MIEFMNGAYTLENQPSIFTSRHGKTDTIISRYNGTGWGRGPYGCRFVTVARIAYETGEYLRQYENVPSEITDYMVENDWFPN